VGESMPRRESTERNRLATPTPHTTANTFLHRAFSAGSLADCATRANHSERPYFRISCAVSAGAPTLGCCASGEPVARSSRG
jgi:hypothetical protein